jgi:hypothetical protein
MFFPFVCVFISFFLSLFPHCEVLFLFYFYYIHNSVGQNCSVGMATHYRLDGPGIKSRWGREFLHPSRPGLGPTQPLEQWVPGLTQRGKWPGCGVDHPTSNSANLKERVDWYLYSTSGPWWPVLGWNFTFINRQYNYISIPATGFVSLSQKMTKP